MEKALLVKVAPLRSLIKNGAEVYEDSSFIKSLGLPTRVRDRNYYLVRLNDGLDVEFYKRQGQMDPVQ